MLKIGAVAYPVALLLLARKMPSPVAAFRRAGAYSAATARKPGSLGLSGAWLFEGALRSGLVVATPDGRYYLDREKDRRRRRVFQMVVIGFLVVTTPLVAWVAFG